MDVVGNLLWLAVGVAMGLSVGVDVVCELIGFAVVEFIDLFKLLCKGTE